MRYFDDYMCSVKSCRHQINQISFSIGCLTSMADQKAFKYGPRRGAASFPFPPDVDHHLCPRVHLSQEDVSDCRAASEMR